MKYHIKTYGCQMNISDSERIATILESAGYKKSSLENEADLIVLNVCSVRQSAIDRISGNFKKYKKYKKKNPNLKIVLTGCVLENDKIKFEKLFDLVIGIKEIKKLPLLCNSELNCHSEFISESTINFRKDNTTQIDQKISEIKTGQSVNQKKILKQVQDDNNINSYFQISPKHQSKITAYVPIMTGCNNFCSYCIVPYTRGREKSRPVKEIINEITDLVKNNYREIILLGQNVNSYKPDEKTDFPKLLKLINNIPGNFWIRFLTSHPKDITEELIKTVAECEKCTEYIHLALQSGNDQILEKMNRKYTAKHFLYLVKLTRKHIPDTAITTDIIVGFPTETKKQFQDTAEIMKQARFDMAYINKYSPRAGTASSKMKDDVRWEEKKKRERILTGILKETALENNQKYIGKTIEVLIEKIDDEFIFGKTSSFKNVKIKTTENKTKPGSFVKVKINTASPWGFEASF